MKGYIIIIVFLAISISNANGQLYYPPGSSTAGQDTLYVLNLEGVSVTAPRFFKDRKEYILYLRYRRYALKVYPYAVKAIQLYHQIEEETSGMKRRKKRKKIKELHRQMKEEFMDPLKKLSKTQGKILIKMIEKELDIPIYYLIKDLRGGATAALWNNIGKLNGYKLKKIYTVGEDPILDMVLKDYNLSYKPK